MYVYGYTVDVAMYIFREMRAFSGAAIVSFLAELIVYDVFTEKVNCYVGIERKRERE